MDLAAPAGAAAESSYSSLAAAIAATPNSNASTFAAAVKASGLEDAILNVTSFTVFIPTDAVSGAGAPALPWRRRPCPVCTKG